MAEVKVVGLTLLWLWSWWSLEGVEGDPQTFLLKWDCSGFMVTNLSNFNKNLNATFADLRAHLTNQTNYFATAQATTGTDPVYAMFQCRNYLSHTDCATCFAAAVTKIRNCSAGSNGARVIYDGCFLRYASSPTPFFYSVGILNIFVSLLLWFLKLKIILNILYLLTFLSFT